MPTPEPTYTVTLTAAELASLRAFLDYAGGAPDSLYAALDAAKPVKPRAPRKPVGPKLLPLPKSPGLPALRPLKVSEIDAIEGAWNAEVRRAKEDVAEGRPSAAETTLRDLIALHAGLPRPIPVARDA